MTDMVTGALGYIGRYIAAELLASGREVKTITTHTEKSNPFGQRVPVASYNFDAPDKLRESLQGVHTLYNTYWVRFDHGEMTFQKALENTEILFRCAVEAGVEKIVQISVTNNSLDSKLPYYRGKALQEKMVTTTGLPYAIVRPTLVFGVEDILVNNIAWLIRKFPAFPIFGDGTYRVQPIFVEDLARIAVESGEGVLDAVGPEIFTFEEFLRLIAARLSPRTLFFRISPALGIAMGNLIAMVLRDRLLTKNELKGLMVEKLVSDQEPNGTTKFSAWLEEHHEVLGDNYTSEMKRHFLWKPD